MAWSFALRATQPGSSREFLFCKSSVTLTKQLALLTMQLWLFKIVGGSVPAGEDSLTHPSFPVAIGLRYAALFA